MHKYVYFKSITIFNYKVSWFFVQFALTVQGLKALPLSCQVSLQMLLGLNTGNSHIIFWLGGTG